MSQWTFKSTRREQARQKARSSARMGGPKFLATVTEAQHKRDQAKLARVTRRVGNGAGKA